MVIAMVLFWLNINMDVKEKWCKDAGSIWDVVLMTIENISWTDKISSHQSTSGIRRRPLYSALHTVSKRIREWLEHVLRRDNLLKLAVEGKC